MNYPVQFSLAQVILIVLGIIGVGLLISTIMSLAIKIREVELLEDEQGNTYKRWRRRRKPRWKHGVSGIVLLVIAVMLLLATSVIQAYLGFSGAIKVGHVYATEIENEPHKLSVDLTLYNPDGSTISRKTYNLEGDAWFVEAHIVRFKSWVNLLGMHSGYKITRLYGKYDDGTPSKQHDIMLSPPDDFYQSVKRGDFWTNPLVDSAYGNTVSNAGGDYDLFIENNAITARRAGG